MFLSAVPVKQREYQLPRRQWDFIYIYGQGGRAGGRASERANAWFGVVTLLGSTRSPQPTGSNARNGQRRSLKIESICALGLEIQIRREITGGWLCPGSRVIIDISIECRSPRRRCGSSPTPPPTSPPSARRFHLTGRNDARAKILHYAGFREIKSTVEAAPSAHHLRFSSEKFGESAGAV